MDEDWKSPGLKSLQGLIWQEGFRSGELRGRVYPDVPPAFKRWRANGLDLHIYSSGSVLAQRLLFETTDAGDLTTCLSGYFDTAVGPKTSAASYRAIAEEVRVPAVSILFVTDVLAELEAAVDAGLHGALCVRDAHSGPSPIMTHPIIRTFDEIAD